MFKFFVVLLMACLPTQAQLHEKISHFSIDCSIFSRDGLLVYSAPPRALHCAFANNGSLLMARYTSAELSLVDKNDKVLWQSKEVAHHKLSFSHDQKKILIMSSEVFNHRNKITRGDCFSVRDLQNKKLHEWCVSKNMANLRKLGFNIDTTVKISIDNRFPGENAELEVSHANAFFEIAPNSSKHPAFAPGNYLVNIFGASKAMLVLDSKLEKILWSIQMDNFDLDGQLRSISVHSPLVTPRGTIVAYFSTVSLKNTPGQIYFNNLFMINLPIISDKRVKLNIIRNDEHSRLVEFDPITQNVLWQYKERPLQKFNSSILGWVLQVDKLHFLFNNRDMLYYTNRQNKILWSFKNISKKNSYKSRIIDTTFFTDTDFLKARNIEP